MTNGNTTNGSTWATEVAANTNGGGGSFFIVVGGKKIAVKHLNNEWIADNTALSIAQGVTMGDTSSSTIDTNYVTNTNYSTNEEGFIADIVDRYGLPKLADSTDYSFSNDIYLNATEQQITEVLDNDGSLTSEKAFNFGFYTKVVIGTSTINLKITQPELSQLSSSV